jgi:outer membrane protein, multidrug efflux system
MLADHVHQRHDHRLVVTRARSHMFRITSHIEDDLVVKVEGCLAGPCVPALATYWRDATNTGLGVRLDLTDACHVDRDGRELLARMHHAGVRIIARGCAMRELVSEIAHSGATRALIGLLLATIFTVACTVGPNYKRPTIDTPVSFRGANTAIAADAAQSFAHLKWFEVFRDDTLTQLVNAALQQNFELRIAAERVLQARALYRITGAERYPSVLASVDGTATRFPQSGATVGIPAGADRTVSYLQAGFSVGWELDVWGRVRRLNEAARAQYLATEEARRGVITTLVADVTQTYLALRTLDFELEIAKRTRDVAGDSVRLTDARRTRGVASALDVRQAEQLFFTSTGQIASLEREIAQVENALSLLLGRMPGDVTRGRPLDAFEAPPAVPAGLPSALLERRPDVRQAEQQLVAANAQIGVAKADYFPRISLTGFFGVQSQALSSLLSGPAGFVTATLGAAAPVLNWERTKGNVQLAESLHREAIVQYERTVFSAFREVSDALAAYNKTREQRGEFERLVTTLRDAARISNERYQGGLDSYLPVLDAQRNLFLRETELARIRQLELNAIVELYRALGGGWSPDMTSTTTEEDHG